jgi:hypothetical protein
MTIDWGTCRLVTDDEEVPRRSVSVSPGEQRRALSVLEEQMDRLRHAEDAARQTGLAFRRAVREVTECQRVLAEAAGRLQRFPATARPRIQGSV